MPYCTIDDIKKMIDAMRLIRLTDDEGSGSINVERLQEAIDSAAVEIDSYIGGRVALPIVGDVPPMLNKLNVDIAIYNVYSRVAEKTPAVRADRYRDAIRFLEKFSEGKGSLGSQPPPDPPDEEDYSAGNRVSARDKMFGTDTMDKY